MKYRKIANPTITGSISIEEAEKAARIVSSPIFIESEEIHHMFPHETGCPRCKTHLYSDTPTIVFSCPKCGATLRLKHNTETLKWILEG